MGEGEGSAAQAAAQGAQTLLEGWADAQVNCSGAGDKVTRLFPCVGETRVWLSLGFETGQLGPVAMESASEPERESDGPLRKCAGELSRPSRRVSGDELERELGAKVVPKQEFSLRFDKS